MAIITSGTQIVGTTRSQIDGNSVHWTRIKIRNNESTKTLFIGNSDVTIANGLPLPKESTTDFELPPGATLWMVSDSGSHSVSWLRIEVQ
jgi:hypothetical protein